MKKLCLSVLLFLSLIPVSFSQSINGLIVADTNLMRIIRVWGSHEERGFAYGYLSGEEITSMFVSYVKPSFGTFYNTARNIIAEGKDIAIDSLYQVEAKAVIEGMNLAGTNPTNLDFIDILVGNSFLDIKAMLSLENNEGCSSLMSWGDATAGTSLEGKSVITRHLDWTTSSILTPLQVMAIHIPSETDEQPWISIGFAGMISALSGLNASVAVFQHVMNDFSSSPIHNQAYEPIWFSMRKALEVNDYNQDGTNNVQDVRSIFAGLPQSTADGYILSALARSDESHDTLIAMVCELAPLAPTHTFRYSTYPDSIPGDNLYAANYQIGRNNMLHFCNRYNGIKSHIGDGTLIDFDQSWTLMRNYSNQANNNQCMTYCPETGLLRFTAYKPGVPAYNAEPVDFTLSYLFGNTIGITDLAKPGRLVINPSMAKDFINISGFGNRPGNADISVYTETGKLVKHFSEKQANTEMKMDVSTLKAGVYLLKVITEGQHFSGKFVVIR